MEEDLDYRRYGRQIALTEIGASGQRALARTSVRFAVTASTDSATTDSTSAARVLDCARVLHERAGGHVVDDGHAIEVTMDLPSSDEGLEATLALGIAAVASVEAARRVLGQAATGLPAALIERLGAASRSAVAR